MNQFLLFKALHLLITGIQQKPAPEAYLGYALYDADSNMYDQGRIVLSKKARNRHEELKTRIFVPKDGYIEAYVVNESEEDVWFDQFRILSTGPVIVQETHYDPWGVELQGLGYQQGGLKVNKYLYNGKEFNDHLGLNLFDYGARMYDASVGRWFVLDSLSEKMNGWSPYNYSFNNPIRFVDPDGKAPCCPPPSSSVFFSEMQKNFGFIKTKVEGWFGSSPSSQSQGNSQKSGVILVGTDGGPDDTGTKGDKISGEVNMDGLTDVGKSRPSGGIMQKIADLLGSILGLVSETTGTNTENGGNNDNKNPDETGQQSNSDTSYLDIKFVDRTGGGGGFLRYKRVINEDTTEVLDYDWRSQRKALKSLEQEKNKDQ